MRKSLFIVALLIASAVWVSSCEFIPNFSNTPSIEFRSIRRVAISPALGDSLLIEISFQDGDGDVGEFDGSGQSQTNDFFATPFKKFNGQFDTLRFSTNTISYNSIMPRMVSGGRSGPIEGTILYRIRLDPPPLNNPNPELDPQPNDTIRFNISIRDRAGNRSNTVTTDQVVVLTP